MALRKFVSINNIGRFHRVGATGDVELKKLTLVYGENGKGKTTLCAVLRSLEKGDGAHITGRTTLGAADLPSVKILLQASTANFTNGQWDTSVPSIMIYDHEFIADNVYSGEEVGSTQRRNLYKVIIGSDAVTKAQRLEVVTKAIRDSGASIKDAERAVSSHLVPGVTLQTLIALQPDPSLEASIDVAQKDLKSATERGTLLAHPGYSPLEIPKQPTGVTSLLNMALPSLTADVEARIKVHREKHGIGRDGIEWLQQGLDYQPDDDCPFCGQHLTDRSLLDAYKTFFDTAYRDLKNNVIEKGKEISGAFGAGVWQTLRSQLAANEAAHIVWQSHINITAPALPTLNDVISAAEQFRDGVLALLRAKATAPLEAIPVDAETVSALESYKAALDAVARYNLEVDKANDAVRVRKADLSGLTPEIAKANHDRLRLFKSRHALPLSDLCKTYADRTGAKTNLETEREEIKTYLNTHSDALVAKYEQDINQFLDRFAAGFQIAKVNHNYVGGVNATYQLRINGNLISLGEAGTPRDKPSFKNTLSAGDRSTLALAFFLAQIVNDPQRSSKVVVLDDPFNSQDAFRRTQTALEICRLAPQVAQVVVLSHDAKFLNDVRGKATAIETKALKLDISGPGTRIIEFDLEKFCRDEIRVLVNDLQMYREGLGGDAVDIAKKVRILLETWSRATCVGYVKPSDILGDILGGIRTAGVDHPLHAIFDELTDLNSYSSAFHHAGSPPPDETELRTMVSRALRVTGAL